MRKGRKPDHIHLKVCTDGPGIHREVLLLVSILFHWQITKGWEKWEMRDHDLWNCYFRAELSRELKLKRKSSGVVSDFLHLLWGVAASGSGPVYCRGLWFVILPRSVSPQQSHERFSYCDFLHVTTFFFFLFRFIFNNIKSRIIRDRASPNSAFFLMVGT